MVQLVSLSLLAGLSAVASAIPTIEVKGSKFFTSEGNQFYVKGMSDDTTPWGSILTSVYRYRVPTRSR